MDTVDLQEDTLGRKMMLVYSGNMTIKTIEALAAKGYQIELTDGSEYVNITKPPVSPPEGQEGSKVGDGKA